jgi:DNA-binding transcriptional ArsR family regulator
MRTLKPGRNNAPARPEQPAETEAPPPPQAQWTIFSNHAHVLVCIVRNPEERVRDIAQKVGITERAVHRIITDLEGAGVIARERLGRRNRYSVSLDRPLRHPLESHRTIAEVIRVIEN